MTQVKVRINGFGCICCLVVRAALDHDHVTLVAVNYPFLTLDYASYQFKYDSVHGQYPGNVTIDGDSLLNGPNRIMVKIFFKWNPLDIPWGSIGTDYMCKSTGIFTTIEKGFMHLMGGAMRVIISALSKYSPMYGMGVNQMEAKVEDKVLSNALCTTNYLPPPSNGESEVRHQRVTHDYYLCINGDSSCGWWFC